MKEKQFVVSSAIHTKDGQEHKITVVGQYLKIKDSRVETITEFDEKGNEIIKLKKTKIHKRVFSMGYSICHPEDEYNEEIGINVALRRIKNGDAIGTLTTTDITMLNDDQCYAILSNELIHIKNNINHYINKKRK